MASATTAPMMTLQQAQALLPGSTLVGDGSVQISRVHSDTRSIQTGDLFVALRGERFDGNDYLPEARAAGAVAALAERDLDASMPGLLVTHALPALQQLAAAWRVQFQLPLVAVAGSNGKTTVTQMVASILRAWLGDLDRSALATAGNLNNHIGLPLTLLRLRASHRAAVIELGMNHAGEIALLTSLARPTVALITNAQREHQEFLSSVEAVAQENGSVIDGLAADGTLVIPATDTFASLWRGRAGARRVLSFALDAAGDVSGEADWSGDHWSLKLATPMGPLATTLTQAGRHNASNAFAAAAAALAAGAPLQAIAEGIAAFQPVAGRSARLQVRLHGRDVTLIDDSYNANPDSVLAAIDVLADMPAPRWLLLGDMGEVGSEGPRFHAEVGARVRERGIDHFWAAGALSRHAAPEQHFADTGALLQALRSNAAPHAASVLVKGSRFMQMERVVRALKEDGGTDAA